MALADYRLADLSRLGICAGSDHAKFAQLRQFPPMEACFLALEPHFCCQFVPCKLHQILATHTSHLSAQVHGAAL
jgi:hypothetical protein